MKFELMPIAYEQKSVLRNLMELCQHDYNEFECDDIDEQGQYGYRYLDHYWTETGRHAFFVRVEGKLAGFALIRTLDPDGDGPAYSLAEFFIVRKYRRQGVGRNAATRLFDRFPAAGEVSQHHANLPAQAFWRRVIESYAGGFTEDVWENGPMLLFRSNSKV